MRKRSKSILAIVLAASVMSGTWSLPTVAADFSSEEILEVEENSGGETGVSQEADNLEVKEDQESNSEEGFFTERIYCDSQTVCSCLCRRSQYESDV